MLWACAVLPATNRDAEIQCHRSSDLLLHSGLQIPTDDVDSPRARWWEVSSTASTSSPHGATDWRQPSAHCCQTASTVAYSDSLAYCATLGGAADRDHWSRSAVDDVAIIDHFVKWSRQALVSNVILDVFYAV